MNNQEFVPFLQKNWEDAGFQKPALIQAEVFAPITERKNLVGIAPTGSGKTLAYLLPLFNQLELGKPSQLLILTSSQELAMQVVEVARKWLAGSGMKAQPLIGGANVKRQQEALKKKPEVLIGTPGRVFELITAKKIKAPNIKTIVFDEVDQLVQGQSLQLVQKILKAADNHTQRLYFSATADVVLAELNQFETDLLIVDVSKEDDSQGDVQHFYLEVSERKKVDQLRRLLNLPVFWGMVFFNQLNDMGSAEEKLLFHHLPVASLASDQAKMSRKAAIEQFKKHQVLGLLTTDLASRGLDIEALPFVINADVPLSEESYLHRAGRVGRMGNTGVVITFVTPQEKADLTKIAKKLELTLAPIYLFGGELLTEEPVKQSEPKKKNKNKKGKRRK
ncbi:DEAD/DEAH box helicase [Enterococcus xiangfangensis]|uniref:DEAD/DEAH box helicase n=1 Tax=Enterococcus xiangfangensis TaxID=1296537 RepID=UPI0010F4D0DB|nr:DEAD/DEAH box helicase [Enterococcus xiangfangensis]MBM7710577.1 superfamily II DNA/RNA helicase [Enterococcus xiangfangensis]NBK08482.1 DEAD/DEAH box helicase [Enterococcus asini]